MRLVIAAGPCEVELAYTWMPGWMALNSVLLREIEAAVESKLVGKDLTDDVLQEAHDTVLDFLEKKFPSIPGLRDYLDSIKFVHTE